MGELGRLIEAYKDREAAHDRFGRRPTNADIARKVGVTRSTVGHWIAGKMPAAESIPALAVTIGETPARVLVAALADSGYLLRERDLDGRNAAAKSRAGGSPADPTLSDDVVAIVEDYWRAADVLRRSGDGRDAIERALKDLRKRAKTQLEDRLARERPDSTRSVG